MTNKNYFLKINNKIEKNINNFFIIKVFVFFKK